VTDALQVHLSPDEVYRAGVRARLDACIGPPDANGCRRWTGATSIGGLPRLRVDATRDTAARRLLYLLEVGPIPADARVRIRVPPTCAAGCMTSAHFFIEPRVQPARTRRQWMEVTAARRAAREAAKPRPHARPRHVRVPLYAPEQLEELERRRRREQLTWRELANLIGVKAKQLTSAVYHHRHRRQHDNAA
jgi:hypothetical protein